MKPLWECDAHRPGKTPDELTVFMGVTVNPADQVRIRRAIAREVREQVAREIEAVAVNPERRRPRAADGMCSTDFANDFQWAALIARGAVS